MKIKINRTLADGLKILLLFDRATSLFTVPDISRRLGYSQSKGYRLVSTLIHYGFLQENSGTAQYCLGLNTFRLGLLAGRHFNLSGIARPLMKELCDLATETVLLTAVSGTKGIVLDRVEAEQPIQYTLYQPGAIIPLYCGASGKILMAYLDEMDWDRIIAAEELRSYTANTITDGELLKAHLREIRKRGYAFSDQEVERDVRSMAAPILNGLDEIVAGLSVVGPRYRINRRKAAFLKKLVVEYGQKISNLLGKGYSKKGACN